jgi:DNA-binding NarL/FixJ family response regulator
MTYKPQLNGAEHAGPARVYVWTHDRLAADGLRSALSSQPALLCVDEPAEADVVLWDAASTPLTAASVTSELEAARARGQTVIALVADAEVASQCLQLGARSVLLRRIHPPSLHAAIVATRLGLCVYDETLAPSLLPATGMTAPALRGASANASNQDSAALTSRELQVLQLLALGLSNAHIAKRLAVSVHTVKFHVNSIMAKLNVRSRTAAVSAALRGGLVTL